MNKQLKLRLFQFFCNIFTLLFLIACTEPAYYVSVGGSDDNPGTRKKPFRTIDKVNSLILKPGEDNCKYIRVKKVHASNNGFSGIHVGGTDRTRSGNIMIQDCRAEFAWRPITVGICLELAMALSESGRMRAATLSFNTA